jgi:hypothetical protein
MVIAITILSVVVVVIAIALTASILHMMKLQKKLQDIAKIEEDQNKALRETGLYLRDLALAIKDIQDYLIEQQAVSQKKMIDLCGVPMGEA